MTKYTVTHAFAYDGGWYTRDNADEIEMLPESVRADLDARGRILDNGSIPAGTPHVADDATTDTTTETKGN